MSKDEPDVGIARQNAVDQEAYDRSGRVERRLQDLRSDAGQRAPFESQCRIDKNNRAPAVELGHNRTEFRIAEPLALVIAQERNAVRL